MIHLRLVSKSFGQQAVLGGIDLKIKAGERIAVLGPSGIGKSTLLRVMAGLDRDFEGEIARPARIAYVFQEPTLLPWRSVAANLALTTGAGDGEVEAALAAVGLSEHVAKYPGQLSLGQQRRAALARALCARPEVLFLDEPFASLDETLADEMRGLVARLIDDSDMAVVLATHARADAVELGARQMQLAGTPARLEPALPRT
jgi:NitT/TauT family transport system ATP-binding protein